MTQPLKKQTSEKFIRVINARQNNLKNISIDIPRNKITVITGLSGSGKSSLAFNTLYAEGQRRFVESLSAYTRQFLERMEKPEVDSIIGLPPAVAIQQKPPSHNPRSTVGTSTEIYDFLRVLYARIGRTFCYKCGKEVKKDTPQDIVKNTVEFPENTRIYVMFPVSPQTKNLQNELNRLRELGFFRAVRRDSNEIIDFEKQEIHSNLLNEDLYILADRLSIHNDQDTISRLTDSVETAFGMGDGRVIIRDFDKGKNYKYSSIYECPDCEIIYQEPTPQLFSFNSPLGACPHCQGFGRTIGWDEDLIIPDKSKSLQDGAIHPLRTEGMQKFFFEFLKFAEKSGIPINIPYNELTKEQTELIWSGKGNFPGINGYLKWVEENNYKVQYRVLASRYRGYTICKVCGGSRLRTSARQVYIQDMNIPKLIKLSIENVWEFFNNLKLSEYENKIVGQIIIELKRRLKLLVDIGLEYLTLARLSHTLSGGEIQRINLATALGSSLVGTLFILDEPSIGLHPTDTGRLIGILKQMRDIGNTILVVEHDLDIIQSADHIIELGPKSGELGGQVVFQGNISELMKSKKSITAEYLTGKKKFDKPRKHRLSNNFISVINPRENNLSMDRVDFPLGGIVVVTGVSGSGKSSLVFNVLYSGIKKILGTPDGDVGKFDKIEGYKQLNSIDIVDQSPIGRSTRSTPATYTKAFDAIRELFASTQLARQLGLKPGYFSFNVPGGRCETCQGEGMVTIDMQFLADVQLVCESCNGTRYKREALEFKYRGKNIVDVLNMSIDEAIRFFEDVPNVRKRLATLQELGLGYLRLGQSSSTLSGGESQRIKIANYLETKSLDTDLMSFATNLLIFDEPTTGLHLDDISKLYKAFNRLVEEGNSLIIVEHNLEVISNADWIIDLGPGPGERGGKLIGAGTPEEISKLRTPTGIALQNYFAQFKKSISVVAP